MNKLTRRTFMNLAGMALSRLVVTLRFEPLVDSMPASLTRWQVDHVWGGSRWGGRAKIYLPFVRRQ